jgi:ABC-type transport system involved in cytochrome c biogenesis permease subunit
MKKHLPLIALLAAAAAVIATLFPPHSRGEYNLTDFGRLPTLVNGRIKPLDTVARTSLLMLQGRQRVKSPDGRSVAPEEWLLDVLFRPEVAHKYQTFEIVHPDLLALLNLTTTDGAGGKRFSYDQINAGLAELDRQAKLADNVESAVRTPFQRAVIQLRDAIILYQRLQNSLLAPGVDGFLDQLAAFEQTVPAGMAAVEAKRAGRPHDAAAAAAVLELGNTFANLDAFGYLLPIPPLTAKSDSARWSSAGASLRDSLATGRLNPAMKSYIALGQAWRHYQPAAFNQAVREYRGELERDVPVLLRKCDVEMRFNVSAPFYTSSLLYVVAFLLAVFSWLKWPDLLGRSAFWLIALAWVLSTAGIGVRMWLENRPPVTNLYSSALFVGWGAVALCLVLEAVYRNAIGSVAAGLIGFATLLVAHHLALGGDTMEMMRAVLDSNFWLATHVVTVTVGYSATFLAGFLALIYVLRGVFTRSLNAVTADSLHRMVYGIVCFATLFSFVGTVLGGIWADQSWGRFWGWDPKENGALIIVLWNSLLLHARWGGLVKARGLMVLAIFGNVVTSWSWFGVNMLGVGLHSYGFMDAAFWWLLAFVASQLLVMAIAALPQRSWRSFQAAA